MCREAEHRQSKVLHAANEMVEAVVGRTTSVTVSGGGTKPPNGALVKSQGTERFGKGNPRGCQVRIWKLNASEPLMRSREVGTPCQKLRSMERSDEYSGHLIYWLCGRRLTRGKSHIRACLRNSGTCTSMPRDGRNGDTPEARNRSAV